ncbi:MAG: hypothetical protein AAF203_08470 [Pseudomonadota bacterium]
MKPLFILFVLCLFSVSPHAEVTADFYDLEAESLESTCEDLDACDDRAGAETIDDEERVAVYDAMQRALESLRFRPAPRRPTERDLREEELRKKFRIPIEEIDVD